MDQVQYQTPKQHRREMRSPPPPPLGRKRTMMNLMPSIETVPTFLPSSTTSFTDKQNRHHTTKDPMDRLNKTPYTNMILKRRSAFDDEYLNTSRSSPLFEHTLLISLPPPPFVSISCAQVKDTKSTLIPAMKPTKTLNLTARSA